LKTHRFGLLDVVNLAQSGGFPSNWGKAFIFQSPDGFDGFMTVLVETVMVIV
jgi:hypothetical protein